MVAKGFPTADLAAGGNIPADPTSETAPLKCPRCDSSNTKFCYYNNYSLAQPRHFCKACKRYWTLGGALRNVPVGGGCRKNKRRRKPQSVTLPKTLGRASINSLPIPAVDFSFRSLICDSNLLFTGLDLDSRIAFFDDEIGPDLADFRRSSEGRVVDPAIGGGLDLSAESSHLNWNFAGVCYDWPENS